MILKLHTTRQGKIKLLNNKLKNPIKKIKSTSISIYLNGLSAKKLQNT